MTLSTQRGIARASQLVVVVFGTCLLLAVGALLYVGSTDQAGGGELTLWHIQVKGPTRTVVEAACERFRTPAGGVAPAAQAVLLRVEAFENDAYKTKLGVALGGSAPPDVFHTWGGGGLAALAGGGHVRPLPELDPAEREAFYAPVLAFCRAGGRLYALPADVGVVVFWYNEELFRKQEATVPKTWEELLDLVRHLRGKGVTPIALGNGSQWPGAFYFAYLVTRLAGTEHFRQAAAMRGGRSFADAPFIAAGRRIGELVEAGAFAPGFAGLSYADSRRAFYKGQAAMMLMGTWLVANARDEAPEFVKQLKAFPFPRVGPAGGPGDARAVLGGVNAGYAVWSGTPHAEAAERLVRILCGREAAQQWAGTGRIPARRDVDMSALLPPTQAALQVLAQATDLQLYYDQYLPPSLKKPHLSTTAALFTGTMSPEEAARKMAEVLRAHQDTQAGP